MVISIHGADSDASKKPQTLPSGTRGDPFSFSWNSTPPKSGKTPLQRIRTTKRQNERMNAPSTNSDALPTSLPQYVDGTESQDDQVIDSRRNWSPDVLLKLVKIWCKVRRTHPEMNKLARAQLVYDEFKLGVDCTHRSRKAVDDKMYSMMQMYQFIVKMNGNFKQGYRKNAPSWFELTPEERRAVRSLHRIRIPNISLEIFNELDRELNPNPFTTNRGNDNQNTDAQPINSITTSRSTPVHRLSANHEVVDSRRNWSHDVMYQLAKVWNGTQASFPELRGALLSSHVYQAFMAVVGCSNRSRKAIDDKMHSMKEMYRFIKTYEMQRSKGDPKPSWFDLTKQQRKAIRMQNKIRTPNLSPEIFAEIDALMNRQLEAHAQNTAQTPESPNLDSIVRYPFAPIRSNVNACIERQDEKQSSSSSSSRCDTQPRSGVTDITEDADDETAVRRIPPEDDDDIDETHEAIQVSLAEQPNISNANSHVNGSIDEQPPPKRRKTVTHPPKLCSSCATASKSTQPVFMEPTTVCSIFDQLKSMLEQDQHERRQQHAEHMAALQEIAQLLKTQQAGSNP